MILMSNYYTPNIKREFDLIDFLWKLMMQWKAILIVCIIMALLVPSVKYISDKSIYDSMVNEQIAAKKEASLPTDKRIEKVLNQLPVDQRGDVIFVMQQKELVKLQKEYLDSSILLNVNPTSQRQIRYSYLVKNDSNIDMQTIYDAYSTYLRRESFMNYIREIISPKAKLEYIYELVTTQNSSSTESTVPSAIFSVIIVVPEDTDIDSLNPIVDSAVFAAHDEISTYIGEHSITNINIDDEHTYNKIAADQRSSITYNINSLNSSIDSATNKFSEEQRVALDAITAIEISTNSKASSFDDLESATEKAKSEVPGFSKKYTVLGFIFGGIIYAGIYLVILVLSKKLASSSVAISATGTRLLGEMYRIKKHLGLDVLFASPTIAKWRYGDKLDAANQIESISSVISSVCTHNKASSLTLLVLGVNELFSADFERIVNKCKSAKSFIKEIIIISATDSIEEKALVTVANVIYVVGSETKKDHLTTLKTLCKEYDIKCLGTIYAEAC